ncbi:MAG: hypothetical protein CVT99_10510 [Bacteroidetes bacterium HGW-Bacteroidetes-16]|jgi:hypothetical protein|nr:MAG: hypothetical protein CVT99_10510 [Bacteroidetes bacterium HGW-Bacteroidetes-16]
MREIVILIPDIDKEQNVEIDVRINGKKKTLQYRVELLSWEGSPEIDRITVLKHKLKDYDKDWELVEIGPPTKTEIPLMFRRHQIPQD